jgi:hypothetical protein
MSMQLGMDDASFLKDAAYVGIESTLAAILIKNSTITFGISQGEQLMITSISRRTTHAHIH